MPSALHGANDNSPPQRKWTPAPFLVTTHRPVEQQRRALRGNPNPTPFSKSAEHEHVSSPLNRYRRAPCSVCALATPLGQVQVRRPTHADSNLSLSLSIWTHQFGECELCFTPNLRICTANPACQLENIPSSRHEAIAGKSSPAGGEGLELQR